MLSHYGGRAKRETRENVLRTVNKELEHEFWIAHTTIQVEVGGCEPNDMFCVMKVAGGAAANGHGHGSHESDDQNVSHDH